MPSRSAFAPLLATSAGASVDPPGPTYPDLEEGLTQTMTYRPYKLWSHLLFDGVPRTTFAADLTIPPNPMGVIFKAGIRSRGMYVGFRQRQTADGTPLLAPCFVMAVGQSHAWPWAPYNNAAFFFTWAEGVRGSGTLVWAVDIPTGTSKAWWNGQLLGKGVSLNNTIFLDTIADIGLAGYLMSDREIITTDFGTDLRASDYSILRYYANQLPAPFFHDEEPMPQVFSDDFNRENGALGPGWHVVSLGDPGVIAIIDQQLFFEGVGCPPTSMEGALFALRLCPPGAFEIEVTVETTFGDGRHLILMERLERQSKFVATQQMGDLDEVRLVYRSSNRNSIQNISNTTAKAYTGRPHRIRYDPVDSYARLIDGDGVEIDSYRINFDPVYVGVTHASSTGVQRIIYDDFSIRAL